MLEFEVLPERSLGNDLIEFLLGMPIQKAIQALQKQDAIIKNVQLSYNEEDPLMKEITIDLTEDGIKLFFDSDSQLLKMIEVYNLSKVKLKYCGSVFNAPNTIPNTQQIDQTFGATHPADYDVENQLFLLNFRGLSFEFKLKSKCEPKYTHGFGSLEFKQGTSPVVSRMMIYCGSSINNIRCPAMPASCFQGSQFSVESTVLFDNTGFAYAIRLTVSGEGNFVAENTEKKTKVVIIRFGHTCQDVVSLLGSPCRLFYKDDNKMKIHSTLGKKTGSQLHQCDYFFNYFTLGVDLLFDGLTQRLKKFILHTNCPGHYDFNVYHRCRFNLSVTRGETSLHNSINSSQFIKYDTKWHTIQDMLVQAGTKPVVLNRAPTTNTTNPFGCTYCHAAKNVIFEVMQNDYIATITIYKSKS